MAAKMASALGIAVRHCILQCRAGGLISVQPHRTRYKRISRGKWPEEAKTFQQRLDEINTKDPELDHLVNIGFPLANQKVKKDGRYNQWKKTKGELEYAARNRELKLDVRGVKEKWVREQGPRHIRIITEHYGIFHDLFGSAFFYNTVPMSVSYDYDEEFVTPVCYGNRIPPSESAVPPCVEYESNGDTLWTIVMTSPDGNLQHNDKECLHWMIGNIPGSEVEKGEMLCDYLQPFPVNGVGDLRYVFVLYKQNKRLDLSSYKRPPNCCSLSDRTFSTLDFYQQLQEDITPTSTCFFQSKWDSSVRSVFHDFLDMPEPSYEFIRPQNYHPAQRRYPHKEPFNLYLDRYRDVRDIQEEVLKERLKRIDPLSPPSERPKYPNIVPLSQSMPTWLRLKIKHMRLGNHQWKDLYSEQQ